MLFEKARFLRPFFIPFICVMSFDVNEIITSIGVMRGISLGMPAKKRKSDCLTCMCVCVSECGKIKFVILFETYDFHY
jgi:hypothetical protein